MKQFNGYDEASKNAQYSGCRLPAGAYVCKVMNVRYENGEDGNSDRIQVQFDIAEGEQKDFFRKQYDNNQSEDKVWKGKVTIYVPLDNGSEQDEWTKNSFAKWTNAFELSNPGYKWDWHEEKWKGLIAGIVFGDTGTVIDGKEIIYTEPRFACDVKKVREDKAPTAKFKAKNGYTGSQNSKPAGSEDFMKIADGLEEDIPY